MQPGHSLLPGGSLALSWGLCLMACWTVNAGAAPQPPIMVVTGPGFAPFTDADTDTGGLAVELVERSLAGSGIAMTLSWRPWKRGYEETKRGSYAATFPYAVTEERARAFYYSTALLKVDVHVYARRGERFDPAQLATFAGKRICTPLGWAPPSPLLSMLRAGAVRESRPQDLATCARMVALGRADFFLADRRLGNAALAESGEGDVVSGGRFASNALYLIAPKSLSGSPALIASFNKGLARLKQGGEYDRIIARYARMEGTPPSPARSAD
jgi:polar amino acid transport system substrate-binding protein